MRSVKEVIQVKTPPTHRTTHAKGQKAPVSVPTIPLSRKGKKEK